MVWIAIANVGNVVLVLHVDDECVSGWAMDGPGLQEGDVFEGRGVLPCDVELLLLEYFGFVKLVLLGLLDSVCDVGTNHVLKEVDFDFARVVGVVEIGRG